MANEIYIKCPKCDLNYCTKKEKICSVCKQKIQTLGINIPGQENDGELGLCPICKVNYITEDETVCSTCYADTDLTDEELNERYGHNEIMKEGGHENDDEDNDGLEIIDSDDPYLADDDDLELINVDGINTLSRDEEEEEEEEEENNEDDDPLSDFDEEYVEDEDDDEDEDEDGGNEKY